MHACVRVCVCVCVCMCVSRSVDMCVHVSTSMCKHSCECKSVHPYICMCMHRAVYVHIYTQYIVVSAWLTFIPALVLTKEVIPKAIQPVALPSILKSIKFSLVLHSI